MPKVIYSCLECQGEIISKYASKFCSRSCAATFNNKRRGDQRKCPNCSESLDRRYNKTFCNAECGKEYRWKQTKIKILEGNGSSRQVKKFLLEKGHKCNTCQNTEWNNQPIPLELEHIDGNSDNNKLDNVELLCPNCHAQTPTYKSKNNGNGRHKRRVRYQNGLSY